MLPFGISVVIPTYNRNVELFRAINSVFSINIDMVEILVIDDCSDEQYRVVIPEKNSCGIKVKFFRLFKNKGPQAARNLGIRRANYSYIAFLDSDDAYYPEKIDTVLKSLEKNPTDILFHSVNGMSSYNKLARKWYSNYRKVMPLHWLIVVYNPIPTPSLILKRKRILGVEKFRFSEDWSYLIRYINKNTTVQYLDTELAKVFRSVGTEGGLSGSIWPMRSGELQAKSILLRSLSFINLSKYIIGLVFFFIRVINDLVRGRYWKK